jgi:HEAT repeat protein
MALLFVRPNSLRFTSDPLVSGKPVAYWLNRGSAHFPGELLPGDSPLADAGPEIIPALVGAIKRRYSEHNMVNSLRRYFPFLRRYLPEYPPGSAVRGVAVFRLGLFGSAASNAVPLLVELFKNPPADFGNVEKFRDIQALGFIGPAAKEAVPVLVASLSDTNEMIRMSAAHSLLQIGSVPRDAVPALKRNVSDREGLGAPAAVALLEVEPGAEALARVKSMLVGPSGKHDFISQIVRGITASELAYVQIPDEIEQILRGMLEEDNPSVRQGAALALARPHARDLDRIIPVLIEGLDEGQFQIPCAQALGRIGPEAAAAKPALKQAAQIQVYVLRNFARDALAKVSGPQTNGAVQPKEGQ